MSDPFAALAEAQATEFGKTPAPEAASEPTPAVEGAEPVSAEPAGDAPEDVEPVAATALEGEPVAEPTIPAGDPPGEASVSPDEDYAVALRAAGNDPNKIPAKLRETLDKYSKTNNELLALKKENEALKAQSSQPATPQAPATPAPNAPVKAAATVSAEPDPKAVETEVNGLLQNDAEFQRASRGHFSNLAELVKIVGGTDEKGQPVKGKLAEIQEEIEDLSRYSPDRMAQRGIRLDEFALSQFDVPKIEQRIAQLEAKKATLEARDVTLRLQNEQFISAGNRRHQQALDFVTSKLTSAARETEESTRLNTEADSIANTYNSTFSELATLHGLVNERDRKLASLAAQDHFRKNPNDAFDAQKLRSVLEREIKEQATHLDQRKRDAVRATALRKDEITKPNAPAGVAAVAQPNSSKARDPFDDLKAADRQRYKGVGA